MALPMVATPAKALPRTPVIFVGLLFTALLIRIPHFGDPAFLIDEQFYLLVGDRMLHGTLPYVDIWDRKPIGLFLIYAFARLLGGTGFVQYQLIATAFAASTAFLIQRIARHTAGEIGGIVAGILYLIWIEIAEGGGGQTPVFYNLPVAGAALLILSSNPKTFRTHAFVAMALIGIAIQIKYTVVVEGLFFGLVLAWKIWRHATRRGTALVEIGLLALAALTPTVLALGFYAAIGQAHAFWFANFSSIFLRQPSDPVLLHNRLMMALLRIMPLGLCAVASAFHLRSDTSSKTRSWQCFMLGWIGAALAAFFSIGVYYSHYVLPLFLPLTIAAAPIFRRWPSGVVLAGLCFLLPASPLHWPDFDRTARSQRQIAALSALVPTDVSRGCMQMFDGPTALYYVTHACTVSRFVFPDHLSAEIEERATGADPVAEVKRILAIRPEVITIGDRDVRPPNRASFATMRAGLARYYRYVGKSWVDERYILVFVRR